MQDEHTIPPDPARLPTPQGTTSHCPEAPLRRISKATSVPVEKLAKVTVRQTATDLYNAILAYAALSPTPNPAAPIPLMIRELIEDKDDDDDEENKGDKDAAMRRAFTRMADISGESVLQKGLGLKSKLAPFPKVELGTSECAVVWPPPPQFSAERVRDGKERDRKRRKLRSNMNDADSVQLQYFTTGIPNDTGMLEGSDVEERSTIFIIHYTVGHPKATSFNIIAYREILLVSENSHKPLLRFTEEVVQWFYDQSRPELLKNRFSLYRFKLDDCGRCSWSSEGSKRARPASSVILPEGQIEAILDDVGTFVRPETKKWYVEHGLPHRRSYLFYGPPGTGKTSCIRVIASKFGFNCCYLSMVNKKFSNQVLGDALSEIPSNALIVLEDVDSLFNENRKSEEGNSLTFSGLLNALDGLISADGVITIMTTNHAERLDKALIRGGRVDRRFCFPRPNDDQIKRLFQSFYPNTSEELASKFLKAVRSRTEGNEASAISTLQQLFIDAHQKSDEDCVLSIESFYEGYFPKLAKE